MLKKILSFFFFSFLLFPRLSFSQNIYSEKHVLDNGLTVLISSMPTSPSVSVYGFIKSGSATEDEFLGAGISHLVEHMVFKGTEKRKVGEIPALIQSVGGTINASTNKDHIVFTVSVPYQHFDIALDVLSDMLMNATFDAEEFKKEKEVIVNEIRMHNDNPDRRLNEMIFSNVYLNHPYRHPIIGYESLFVKLTREDAIKYYKRAYAPQNMIISIAGQINPAEILEKIKKTFYGFERQMDRPRHLPVEPQQISERFLTEEYPTPLTRLAIAFQGVNVLHEDLFALDVLSSILGEGKSSRLYERLYQKEKLVYSISASNYTPMDKGFFSVNALLAEEKLEKVISVFWEEVEKIKKNVSSQELNKVKKNFLAQYILDQQTSSSVTGLQAIYEAFTGDYRFSEKYVKAVQNLKTEDIKRVAQKYLNKDFATTVVLKPQKQEKESFQGKKIATPEIQKVVLDNGIVVLLREDHTFPTVAMNLLMPGGMSQEPQELNGLANLTANLLTKGTVSKNAQQISQLMDSLGLRLSASSGRNNFGISLECVSDDFLAGLDLLEDIFKNPVFSQEELEKEKERLKAVIKSKDDSIFQATNRELRKLLFLTHPARFEAEGSLETIERITKKDAESFYFKFIDAKKIVISVFGDIDSKSIIEELRKRFGKIAKKDVTLKIFKEAPPETKREKQFFMPKDQAMLALGFQGPDMFAEDRYGVEVLTGILGSSFNGRMFQRIREKLGKAYSLGGSYSAGVDMGLIHFYILTTPENLGAVKESLLKEFEEVRSQEVPEEELNKIKEYLKGRFLLGLETNASWSSKASADEFFGLGFKNYETYSASIDKITAEAIKALAVKYLDINKSAVVLTNPKEK